MYKATYTLPEAAELLSCHAETIRRAIKEGALKAARLGREYRLSRLELQRFWQERGGGQLFDDVQPQDEAPQKPCAPPAASAQKAARQIPAQYSFLEQDTP